MRIKLDIDPSLINADCEVFAVVDPRGPNETYTGITLVCIHRGHGRTVWTEGLRRDFRTSFSERWHSAIPALDALLTTA